MSRAGYHEQIMDEKEAEESTGAKESKSVKLEDEPICELIEKVSKTEGKDKEIDKVVVIVEAVVVVIAIYVEIIRFGGVDLFGGVVKCMTHLWSPLFVLDVI
ncbi:hypothetical protein Scep_004582 [Stephania cephalantha]|uniref:Uncharacterized protein n=1 Tax=Stephania cephalantha TaxID=152367 RepID=A0AAP0KSQ5_9MAGN